MTPYAKDALQITDMNDALRVAEKCVEASRHLVLRGELKGDTRFSDLHRYSSEVSWTCMRLGVSESRTLLIDLGAKLDDLYARQVLPRDRNLTALMSTCALLAAWAKPAWQHWWVVAAVLLGLCALTAEARRRAYKKSARLQTGPISSNLTRTALRPRPLGPASGARGRGPAADAADQCSSGESWMYAQLDAGYSGESSSSCYRDEESGSCDGWGSH